MTAQQRIKSAVKAGEAIRIAAAQARAQTREMDVLLYGKPLRDRRPRR